MSLFQKNLASLQADSSLAHNLQSVNGISPVYFERSSPFNFAYIQKEEKNYPLQSLRGPAEEAERLVKHWRSECHNKPGVYVLLGISSMHLISEFLKKLGKNSELLIVEPSPVIFKSFLENNDISELYRYEAGFTVLCPFEQRLEKAFRGFINSRDLFCLGIFISPANTRFRPTLLEERDKLQKQVKLEALDRVTSAKFADEWTQNCLINLPEIAQSPGINNFCGLFPDTDCFVVCAGPSLNDSLKIIKEKSADCFIIAVGTALKPLLNAGIQPNLTIVVDSDPIVYKQFEGLEEIPGYLLATHTIFPGIYQKFNTRSICFNSLVSKHFSNWLEESGFNHGTLNVGGTVALSAIDCAIKLGFASTYIFGLDLAFAEDGTSHAKNSMYQDQKIVNNLVEIPGNWNKKVKTTKQFAYYVEILRGYIMDFLSGYRGKIFNVNNAGAQIGDIDVIKPEAVLSMVNRSAKDFKSILDENFRNTEIPDISAVCESSLEELNDISSNCNKLLSKMENGRIPDELQAFEETLKASKVSNTLTAPALHAYCMNLRTQLDSDPFEMTKNFLIQVAGASEWIEGLLKNSYERFLKQTKGVHHGA